MAPSLPTAGNASAHMLALSFAGLGALSSQRSLKSFGGTTVTVSFNGHVVATGTLNASGSVTLALPGVPAGTTIAISAGAKTATTVLATTAPATIVSIVLNADGTLTVTSTAATAGASPAPTGEENESEIEDHQGNPESISDDSKTALPANLPFTVSTTCTAITLTPNSATLSRLFFEEKGADSDNAGRAQYDGPFNSAVTMPIVAAVARIHIIVFDQSGKQIVEVKAPINAFTPTGTSPTPAPCPTVAPTPTPAHT